MSDDDRLEADLDPTAATSPAVPDDDPATAPVPTAEEIAALAAATAAAMPLGLHDPVRPANDAETVAQEVTQRRRLRIKGWMFRLASFVVVFSLFILGIGIGMAAFDRSQTAPPALGDPATGGVAAPAVVAELASALAANDADSLRSAVSSGPYRLLTGELQRWDMQGVTSVETLATMLDGTRSATEIIVTGRTTDGNVVVFNLVVHVDDSQIVNFR